MKTSTVDTVIAIQGGAMRSVYCVGALRAFIEQKAISAPIHFVVSSAGCVASIIAIASAFDLKDYQQITTGLMTKMASKRFINLRRLKGIVDVDYLASTLVDILKNAKRNLTNDVTLVVSLTDVEGQAAYRQFNMRNVDYTSIQLSLKATMAIPVLYPSPVTINEKRYFDGGIADPLPLVYALQISDGQQTIAIANKPLMRLGNPYHGVESIAVKASPSLPKAIKTALHMQNQLGSEAATIMAEQRTNLISVFPAENEDFGSRLNIDLEHLWELEKKGYDQATLVLARKLWA